MCQLEIRNITSAPLQCALSRCEHSFGPSGLNFSGWHTFVYTDEMFSSGYLFSWSQVWSMFVLFSLLSIFGRWRNPFMRVGFTTKWGQSFAAFPTLVVWSSYAYGIKRWLAHSLERIWELCALKGGGIYYIMAPTAISAPVWARHRKCKEWVGPYANFLRCNLVTLCQYFQGQTTPSLQNFRTFRRKVHSCSCAALAPKTKIDTANR